MDVEIATVDVDPGCDSHVKLSGVPMLFNPGEASPYVGADGPGGVVTRAGWLGLKTEPFTGWFSAHIISVAGERGTDAVYEVKRNFNTPRQDGEWLWFPASPQNVEPYRD